MPTERAPLDIASYSAAYLQGKLDKVEIAELREAMDRDSWTRLVHDRQMVLQMEKLNAIKAKNREQIDLSDVVALLVMILEKP